MSAPLAKTTCLIHPARPAAARCPSCGAFFCGECITEHEGRLTCARCLSADRETKSARRARAMPRLPLMAAAQLLLGLFLLWILCHGLAQVLLSIPADLHDGVIWR